MNATGKIMLGGLVVAAGVLGGTRRADAGPLWSILVTRPHRSGNQRREHDGTTV